MESDSESRRSTRIKLVAMCVLLMLSSVLLYRGLSAAPSAEPLAPEVREAVEEANRQADAAPPPPRVEPDPNEPISSGVAQPVQPTTK